MRQYKITSADFITPGEIGDPDAYMDSADLAALKAMVSPNGMSQAKLPSDAYLREIQRRLDNE